MSDSHGLIGLDDAIKWADLAVQNLRKRVIKEVEKTAKEMVEYARKTHEFNRQTGAVDRSIKAEVTVKGNTVSLLFYMDPSTPGVMTNSGYNRSWMLNDGTLGNYSRGSISPAAVTVGGSAGTGLRHDDFMGATWKKYTDRLEKRLEKIYSEVF